MATRNSTRSCTNRKKIPTFNLFFPPSGNKDIKFIQNVSFLSWNSNLISGRKKFHCVFIGYHNSSGFPAENFFSPRFFFNFPLWTSESFFSNLNFNSSRSLPLWFRTFCAAFAVSAEKKPRKKCIILWREMEIYGVKNWVGKFCCNTKSSSSCYHKFQLKFLI